MKKIYLLFIFIISSLALRAQTSSQLLYSQATPFQTVDTDNMLGVRWDGVSAFRIYPFPKWLVIDTVNKMATKTNLLGKENKILPGTINQYRRGDNTWQNLTTDAVPEGSNLYYTNARVISATSALYKPISYTPNSGDIISGLGYTPYNSTNPNGYISSFTELDPTVPTYAKSLSSSSVIKSATDTWYKPIGYSPSSSEIATGLGYTPVSPATLTSTLSSYVTNSSLTSSLSNYVTNSSLTSTLGSYATTSALTSGLSGKQNSLILTTTGSGAATLVGSTLNIPTPATNNYTAGNGISIANNVITNTAPDQTVTLTAGNRINITGNYPNFTISYIEPTPSIVARPLNSNYTISNKQATVFYSILATTTNPLLIGTSAGNVYLEYSTNGGSTWNNATQISSTSGVGITVTVALTTGGISNLSGVIPGNALVRIRTTTTGTATVNYVTGQETY